MGRPYAIKLTKNAERDLAGIDRSAQVRIRERIDDLGENPRPPGAKKLVGADSLWRVRIGDYRVVYSIDDGVLVVLVVRIGHRREIYR